MSEKLERRIIAQDTEVRVIADDGKEKVVEGYAALYNVPSRDLGGFKEVIKPGAFARAIKEKQDVKGLVNHDPNQVFGRSTRNMTLSEDKKGLKFRAVLPNTQTANDLHENVRAGLMDQCSFGFVAKQQRWTNSKETPSYRDAAGAENKQIVIRELHDVDLRDVSVVANPAYTETSASARADLSAVELRTYFPDGIPTEVAEQMAKMEAELKTRGMDTCECECPECEDGDCADCSNANCTSEDCKAMRGEAQAIAEQERQMWDKFYEQAFGL